MKFIQKSNIILLLFMVSEQGMMPYFSFFFIIFWQFVIVMANEQPLKMANKQPLNGGRPDAANSYSFHHSDHLGMSLVSKTLNGNNLFNLKESPGHLFACQIQIRFRRWNPQSAINHSQSRIVCIMGKMQRYSAIMDSQFTHTRYCRQRYIFNYYPGGIERPPRSFFSM